MQTSIRSTIVAVGIAALGFAAIDCGGKVETSPETDVTASSQQSLAFDEYGKDAVSGTFTDGDNKLIFISKWSEGDKSVDFLADGQPVGSVGYAASSGLFTADAELTPIGKQLILGLISNLKTLDENGIAATFGDDVSQTAMGLLFNYASHYASAPLARAVHYEKVWPIDGAMTVKSYGGEGIKYLWECSRKSSYKYSTAEWTDSRGYESAYTTCGTWAPECEGRCGAGCPCNSWYCVNRYYTKDCFDHDVCLDNNPGDGHNDPFAPNCGDEWGDASDDVLFGSSSGW